MKKSSAFLSFLAPLLLMGSLVLSGCSDDLTSHDTEEQLVSSPEEEKLRHANMLNRATRVSANGSQGNVNALGLIVAINKQSVIERMAVVERLKVLDRYKVVERFEYNNVIGGYALSIEDLEELEEYNEFLDLLENDPDVLWYEPDFAVDNPDPSSTDGGSGQQVPWSVAAIGGMDSWTQSGDGSGSVDVDVYIIDSGVAKADPNDPDDDLYLYESIDFREGIDEPRDNDGHGTHIAGIIAAIDDQDNIVGVAPAARVHNMKVLNDDGTAEMSVVIAAIEHITTEKLSNPETPIVVKDRKSVV